MIGRNLKWAGCGSIALAFVAVCCVTTLSRADQKKVAAGSVLAADKGKFDILVDGKSVGREEFEIAENGTGWVAKGTTHVSMEGSPAMSVTGTLALQPNGAPISYELTSQGEQTNVAQVTFAEGMAKITLQMHGAHPFEQEFTFNTPMVVVLDNNLYHHYAILSKVYDWARGGEQSFSVLIPQQLAPGVIKVETAGTLTAAGKSYEGLKVKTSDIEVLLYLDSNHRLMRLEVPESKAAVIRE